MRVVAGTFVTRLEVLSCTSGEDNLFLVEMTSGSYIIKIMSCLIQSGLFDILEKGFSDRQP